MLVGTMISMFVFRGGLSHHAKPEVAPPKLNQHTEGNFRSQVVAVGWEQPAQDNQSCEAISGEEARFCSAEVSAPEGHLRIAQRFIAGSSYKQPQGGA
jgi:hypothetical protein